MSNLRIDPVFLEQIKQIPVSDVAAQFVELKRKGAEYVGLSPFKTERTPSFTCNDQKGFYHCFATGAHGNVIDLVVALGGADFLGAVRYLAGLAGLELPENIRTNADGSTVGGMDEKQREKLQAAFKAKALVREKEEQERKAKFLKIAHGLWAGAKQAEGTLVERYLLSRGVDLDALHKIYGYRVPPSLKFHPDVYYDRSYSGPAMIAVLQDADGKFTGVHRTWLMRDGSGKAGMSDSKKTMGDVWGSGVRLSPVAKICVVGEGLETTLTVQSQLAARGEMVFGLCGVALGNIAGAGLPNGGYQRGVGKVFNDKPDPARPGLLLPNSVKVLHLLADADGKDPEHGIKMMDRAAYKFLKTVPEIYKPVPAFGTDFNDMAQGVG